jgi:hypothetical protein
MGVPLGLPEEKAMIIAVLLSLLALVLAPTVAARVMGLKGGLGSGALVGLVSLGLMQVIGTVANWFGPLGGLLGIMGFLAAWYQVVRVVHGTDTAKTIVFMFWHLFFLLLFISVVAMFFGPSAAMGWWFGA